MNKNGFAILDVLLLILLASIPLITIKMEPSKKSIIEVSATNAANAAKSAYQVEILLDKLSPESSVCFSIEWLYENDYFAYDEYKGSVLIEYNQDEYNYKVWISNGIHTLNNSDINHIDSDDVIRYDESYPVTHASKNCDGMEIYE